ncbi:hypothetical protein SB6412_00410 [Klebsiella pasteurii]|uniref:hypothetical protein n=1 Tax=Klebsiella pasteurii TaxID=2587529 RepID=UPI00115B9B33|nr:hypothetical protein [Klebsiella pasteurii]VUS28020.1 hypothetical protein SB6412_00410 [Klebsiella pasteurii]
MTIAAVYDHFGCKIMVGDILITGDTDHEQHNVSLPTIGKITKSIDGKTSVYHLFQKINIINKNCIIGWGGNVNKAYEFMNRLHRLSKRLQITKSLILKVFDKIVLNDNDFCIIAAIYNGHSFEHFGISCHSKLSERLGEVFYFGSGSEAVDEFLDNIIDKLNAAKPNFEDHAAQSASIAITQIAHLMKNEILNKSESVNINDFFGGGYEVALFYDGEFRKINVNYIYFEVEVVDNIIVIDNPDYIVCQAYDQKRLKYKTIKTKNKKENDIERNEIIDVEPLIDIEESQFDLNIFNDLNWSCFVFYDKYANTQHVLKSFIIKSEIPPFEYEVIKNKLYVSYSYNAEKHIKEFISKCY